jgi:hypothetical protein
VSSVFKTYEHTFGKENQVAELATKSKPVSKRSNARVPEFPPARIAGAVDRTAKLSDEVLKALETSERSALEAIGQVIITLEEALPQEVAGTSEVAKRITESGLEMADRLVHTQYHLLRAVADRTAVSLSRHDAAESNAA